MGKYCICYKSTTQDRYRITLIIGFKNNQFIESANTYINVNIVVIYAPHDGMLFTKNYSLEYEITHIKNSVICLIIKSINRVGLYNPTLIPLSKYNFN